MRMCHFHVQSGPLALKNIFFEKHNFRVLLAPLYCTKLIKNPECSQNLKIRHFPAKKCLFASNNFFREPINKSYFFHSSLSTIKKSNSDVRPLIKY